MSFRKIISRILVAVFMIVGVLAISIYLGVAHSFTCNFPDWGTLKSGLSARQVESSGVPRCYLVYTPPSYDPSKPIPVVFALHGFADNAQGIRKMSGWDRVADEENFLVVYPHGSSFPLRWNTHPAAKIPQIDDVQFIADILADLNRVAQVDEARVYVSGFSNGGTMTDLVACRLADRVAAVGLVDGKGEDKPATCNPSRPVPIIAFFGTVDPLDGVDVYPMWFLALMNVAPSVNQRQTNSVLAWLDGWVENNGCQAAPEALTARGDARGIAYRSCSQGAEIIMYRIEGGGHTWPGGANSSIWGKTSTDIHASQVMWDFFASHPMAP